MCWFAGVLAWLRISRTRISFSFSFLAAISTETKGVLCTKPTRTQLNLRRFSFRRAPQENQKEGTEVPQPLETKTSRNRSVPDGGEMAASQKPPSAKPDGLFNRAKGGEAGHRSASRGAEQVSTLFGNLRENLRFGRFESTLADQDTWPDSTRNSPAKYACNYKRSSRQQPGS